MVSQNCNVISLVIVFYPAGWKSFRRVWEIGGYNNYFMVQWCKVRVSPGLTVTLVQARLMNLCNFTIFTP